MILVTGAAGFIASCLVTKLNQMGHSDISLVDDFSNDNKTPNFEHKQYDQLVERDSISEFLRSNKPEVIFHLGARTDTTEFDRGIFDKLNLNYSQNLFQYCVENKVPFIYASSAATYGAGEHGYADKEEVINDLQPLNPYGDSKNDFDKWLLGQEQRPPFYAGLKFFNVYGPNEYHKGRMASVILHAYRQIKSTGAMNLFRSHNADYKDGEQMRDFVYVKDVVDVLYFLFRNQSHSGIYNLGSGKARTFLDLVRATFKAMNVPEQIGFIDTPEDIRDNYQYFTEAPMEKLRNIGFSHKFTSLEDGVSDYVQNYLAEHKYF